ncbi:MAG: FtsH protease activity modulator HflK, partial [Abitibacteriaceae bacterium]|nr:FtsH protease activity modulator HflK [Abditibacteriaceae bacterium]
QTTVVVVEEQTPVGVIAVADKIRPEASLVVNGLKSLGLERIVMLSGDAAPTVEAVARTIGIEEFKAGLFPADKVAYLRELQSSGYRIAMVGDGINDAPSLATADVGIAMGHGGADIAVEAADIVFVTDDLARLPETIVISRRALRTVRRSILWFALGLNGLSVVLSATGALAWIGNQLQNQWPNLFGAGGRDISPILAAVEHQIASLLVVGNSLRLLSGRVAWQPGDKMPVPDAHRPQPSPGTGRLGELIRYFVETPAVQALRRTPTTVTQTYQQHERWVQRGAVLALVACWLCSGIYCVPMGQVGVIQRFGQLVQSSAGPGLHYRLPWPVERVTVVDISGVRRAEIGFRTTPRTASSWLSPLSLNRSASSNLSPSEWSTVHSGNVQRVAEESLLLTGDEYLVDANLTLQYVVSDPTRFLFQNSDATTTLREAGETSLRRAVEHTPLEVLLTTGRAALEAHIQNDVQAACDHYQTGLTVLSARLQEVHPPQEVVAAYRDVSSAAEEKATVTNQAEGYRNETIPLAHGQAAQNVSIATGYTFDRLHRSMGDASHFLQMLNGYHLGPQVNADRIYLETVEQALTGPNKFIMDPAGGGRRQMWLSDGQLAGLPGLPTHETTTPEPITPEAAPGQGLPLEPGQ